MHTSNSKKAAKQSVSSFPKRLWQKPAVICDTGQKLTNIAAQRKKKHWQEEADADKAGLEGFVFYVDLV